jgi:hypothetical protein
VFTDDGPVLGTVNLLAEAGHFTAPRLLAYQALATDHDAAMVAAMAGG